METASWSVIEVFTGAPPNARHGEDVEAGYRMTVADGVVRVDPGVRRGDIADVTITLDWNAACEMAVLSSGPKLAALTASHLADGRIRVTGDLRKSPISFAILHDRMVAWAAPTPLA